MTTDEWRANYYNLNSSFKKKLVFRLGVDSGFFSEYNNMILAMLYCLKHGISFSLYSDYSNISISDSWDDFFIPFNNKNRHIINKNYNLRPYIIKQSKEASLQKLVKYKYITMAYKILYGVSYLTQDLWAYHRSSAFANEIFHLPKLGLYDAPLLEATQAVIRTFWHYNATSAPIVARFIDSVGLPDEYISLHVRAGDKFTETKMYDFSTYMLPAQQLSSNKRAFIFTDDYTVIEQLRDQYADWHFYTLCDPSERGYFHRDFVHLDKKIKYIQHLKLFANMDICAEASKFIGTYSSNPGMYMGMRIGPERCHCIDFDKWVLW